LFDDKKEPGVVHQHTGPQEKLSASSIFNSIGNLISMDGDELVSQSAPSNPIPDLTEYDLGYTDALAKCREKVEALNLQLEGLRYELASQKETVARLRKTFTEWNYRMSGGK